MKEIIAINLMKMEKEKNIKILFAVENGSRAWGMESKNSDYDVRFVYARPVEDYLMISPPSECIDVSFDEEGNRCGPEGAMIDMCGFDVIKFTKMLSSSNPTVIEWLKSEIIYYGVRSDVFLQYAHTQFNPTSLYHHYKSMCRNNYLKYLKSGALVTYKKYLYAYRGLINAKYVVHRNKIPPIKFEDALNEMDGLVPDYVLNKINNIIALKKEGKEKDIIQNIVDMDRYIEDFLKDDSECINQKKHNTHNDLNAEVQRIILGG